MEEPRGLAEGRCPPDASCGHLLLIEGSCPSSSRQSPHILLGGNKQNALESSGKGPQNEPLGIIPVPRAWQEAGRNAALLCRFLGSLSRVNTQHFSAVASGEALCRLPGKDGAKDSRGAGVRGLRMRSPSAVLTACWGASSFGACALGWLSKSAVPPTVQLFELCVGYTGLKVIGAD